MAAQQVYAMGRLLATYDSTGTHFHLADALGSRRVQAQPNGAAEYWCVNYPFGDGLNCWGDADSTEQHFTGKEHDAESGNDYFGARYYASSIGRFLSPDWASDPTAVPYASYANPQSLNLYNYMRNNPLGGIDPDGHCCEDAVDLLPVTPETLFDDARTALSGLAKTAVNMLNGIQSDHAIPNSELAPVLQPSSPGEAVIMDVAPLAIPGGEEIEGAKALEGAEAESVSTSAARLASETGKASAEFKTDSSVGRIDLTGKAHFDKATGTKIETPHVHEQQIHTSPSAKQI